MENTRRVQKCLIFSDSIPFGAKNKTENELVSVNEGQVSTPELVVVETSQPTDESDDEKDDSPLATAYLAYVGPDDNLWVLEAGSQTPNQVTLDANRTGGDEVKVV